MLKIIQDDGAVMMDNASDDYLAVDFGEIVVLMKPGAILTGTFPGAAEPPRIQALATWPTLEILRAQPSS